MFPPISHADHADRICRRQGQRRHITSAQNLLIKAAGSTCQRLATVGMTKFLGLMAVGGKPAGHHPRPHRHLTGRLVSASATSWARRPEEDVARVELHSRTLGPLRLESCGAALQVAAVKTALILRMIRVSVVLGLVRLKVVPPTLL